MTTEVEWTDVEKVMKDPKNGKYYGLSGGKWKEAVDVQQHEETKQFRVKYKSLGSSKKFDVMDFINYKLPLKVMERIGDTAESAVGLAENVGHLATAMGAYPVSRSMGAGALIKDVSSGTPDPRSEEYMHHIQDKLTYDPKTEMGKHITESPYHPINLAAKGLQKAGKFISYPFRWAESKADQPILQTALGAIANGFEEATYHAPTFFGGWLKKRQESKAQKEKADLKAQEIKNRNIDKARAEAHANGLITPAEAGWRLQVSGTVKADSAISWRNQKTATDLIKQELESNLGGGGFGLKKYFQDQNFSLMQKNPIDGKVVKHGGLDLVKIDNFMQELYGVYDKVIETATQSKTPKGEKRLIPIKIETTKQFRKEMNDLSAVLEQQQRQFPNQFKHFNEPIKMFKQNAKQSYFDPITTLEAIKNFRSSAKTSFQKNTNVSKAKASAYMRIADSLEGLLENHLKMYDTTGTLFKDFQLARVKLSQANLVRNSMNEVTGMIDIKTFSNLGVRKKNHLTGKLKVVSDFGLAFPRGSKKLAGAPQYLGLFDAVLAGGTFVAGHTGFSMFELAGRLGIPEAATMGLLQNKRPIYSPSGTIRNTLMDASFKPAPALPAAVDEFNRQAQQDRNK